MTHQQDHRGRREIEADIVNETEGLEGCEFKNYFFLFFFIFTIVWRTLQINKEFTEFTIPRQTAHRYILPGQSHDN